jgi:hypothetical protein
MSPSLLSGNRGTAALVYRGWGPAKSRPSALTRTVWLIAACILVPLSLAISGPAEAQCFGASFTLTCSGAFTNNINLNGGPSDTLSITLQPGVVVSSPGGGAVAANNTTGQSPFFAGVSITANNASVTNTSNSSGNNNWGLYIQSAGNATITASGPVAVAGTASDWAIWAIVENGAPGTSGTAMVTYGQPGAPGLGLSTGNLTLSLPGGVESGVIQADNRGTGDAIVDASGNITGFVGAGLSSFYGLLAHSGDAEATGVSHPGSAAISYHTGTINITGDFARGILAWSDGDGSSTVTTDPGTKIILNSTNQGSSGVYAYAGDAMATNGRMVMANVASEIMNFGPATPAPGVSSKPYGIRAENYGDAPISVTYTGLGITTQGMNGVGIGAGAYGGGSINVSSSGPIATNGSGAIGILAQSAGGPIAVTTSGQGAITTQGAESHGIFASSTTYPRQESSVPRSTRPAPALLQQPSYPP